MAEAVDWVPMRWPAEWTDPALLELLKNTPINCLVPSSGTAPEIWKALIEHGRRGGLEFPEVAPVERSKLPRSTPSPVIAVTDNVWPMVKLAREPSSDEDRIDAGPTGVPWVDSNGWVVRLARTLSPGKPVWIVADPSEKTPATAESCSLAVADAAVFNGRWVVSLGGKLAGGIATGNPEALAAWRKIAGTLAFFETHKQWRSYEPQGVLGVLSDFAGPNEFLSTELLNLIPRRHVPFRILDKTRLPAGGFEGLKAIVYADQDPPARELRDAMLAFAGAGGLLISPVPSASLADGSRGPFKQILRYRVGAAGRGRIAVAREEQQDPWVVAADAHTLLSRANDIVRVWNGGPTNTFYAAAAGGGRAVVHILNYIRRPVRYMSLQVRRPYRTGRLWTLESQSPAPLKAISDKNCVEFHLPPVAVYAAVELET